VTQDVTTTAEKIVQEAQSLVQKIQQIDSHLAEYEREKNEYRAQLEEIIMSYGDMNFPGIAAVKIVPGGTTVSFDAQKVQSVIDYLMQNQLLDIASMLVDAQKESPRKQSLRISKWKEK
jgi:DNA gyrase/topoisomerase IV subunit A